MDVKRGLASVLALVLCVTCSACGAAPTGEQQSTAGTTAQATVPASVGEDTTTPSSTTTTTGAQTQNPAENEYTRALAAIDKGEYQTAYELLSGLKGNKDAEQLLGRFVFVVTSQNVVDGRAKTETYRYTVSDRQLVTTGVDTDNLTATVTMQFDAKGQLTTRKMENSAAQWKNETYTYDARGNMLTKVETFFNGDRFEYEYTYDAQGRLLTEKIPLEPSGYKVMTYTYDGALLIKSSRAGSDDGDTTYTYDAAGRLLKEQAFFWTYDYTYDAKGRVASKRLTSTYSSEVSEETYVYDNNGNCVRQDSTVDGVWRSTTTYAYDAYGNLTAVRQTASNRAAREATIVWQPLYLPDGISQTVVNEWTMEKMVYPAEW